MSQFSNQGQLKNALLLLIALASLASCSSGGSQGPGEQKPNVLIILTDDMGYGDISCYSQDAVQTPNIDYLAENGVSCSDFYVPTPYCAPSRETLLTGRFPLRHGLIRNPTPDAGINDIGILPEEITLGEVFQEAGYKTKCIGKWHMGHTEEFFPVKHGFDEYFGILYSNDMRPVQLVENMDTLEYPVDQNTLTKRYTSQALDFIKRNRNESFFLHLCHAMPHKPLAVSDDYYTPDTPEDLYADVIRELDWSTGEIFKTLKELDILDNTIVIFMSDNGPWYGGSTGGLKGMKATTWEGGIRVPFIVHYQKEFPAGSRIDVPCWSPDIFPTLLSLSGVDLPDELVLDGQDITEILKGEQREHAPVFSLHNEHIMSVRKGAWKLFVRMPRGYRKVDLSTWKDKRAADGTTIIARMDGQANPTMYPGIIPDNPEKDIQLFNLRKDPGESQDLSGENPALVEDLMQELELFKNSINH
jgi:arylsulfatase A-like enzyme